MTGLRVNQATSPSDNSEAIYNFIMDAVEAAANRSKELG